MKTTITWCLFLVNSKIGFLFSHPVFANECFCCLISLMRFGEIKKRKNALRASSSSVHFQIGHKECANFNPMVIVNGWFCCSIKFSDIKNVKACRPLPLASCFCQFPNLSQGPCKECVIFRPTSVGGSAV